MMAENNEKMTQVDFIADLGEEMPHIVESILFHLDARSLCNAERVCRKWYRFIVEGKVWEKILKWKIQTDSQWQAVVKRRQRQRRILTLQYEGHEGRGDDEHLKNRHGFYKRICVRVASDVDRLQSNWGNFHSSMLALDCQCHCDEPKNVYSFQFDDSRIVTGLRDHSIKVWDRRSPKCNTLRGHRGSVLCVQFDEEKIVSGSRDGTVKVWDLGTGDLKNTLNAHTDRVFHVRFSKDTLVTCSGDCTVIVWDVQSPTEILLRHVLLGHGRSVNVVSFNEKCILSGSADRRINVWNTSTGEFVHTMRGHTLGVISLHHRANLAVSGSLDNTIRLWDVERGVCLRVVGGHESLVRCVRFDGQRIVSGDGQGRVKVWDLRAARNPDAPEDSLCLHTFDERLGRVFSVQFDELQIVASTSEGLLVTWDFLDAF